MTVLAIEIEEDLKQLLESRAQREGLSPIEWARQALRSQLADRLPESFFEVLGTWEDDRDSEEIIRSLREDDVVQAEREPLR